MTISYADATKISKEDAGAAWSTFYAAVKDGEHIDDAEALEKLIRGQSVVVERKDQISHGGLRYEEILGLTPVDSTNEQFIWISMCKGDDWSEACMAEENTAEEFLHQQTYDHSS